jgi:5-carboxymethyl-2-hydroxymuconate isomerase
MPHLTILYTRNLDDDASVDLDALCRRLADAMLAVRDEEDRQVFPTGGVRVLAFPAAHSAVADGKHDYAFLYMNLRMGRGRSAAVRENAGKAISSTAREALAPLMERRFVGLTVQVDEGPEVFDDKHSTIHPLFRTPQK